MPVRVTDEQGTTHVFPDGSTPEMIAKAMKVKVGGNTAPKEPGFSEPHPSDNPVQAFFRGGAGAAVGLAEHPIESIFGMPNLGGMPGVAYGSPETMNKVTDAQVQGVKENAQGINDAVDAAKENPAYTAGGIILPMAVTHGISKVLPKIGEAIRPGTRAVKDLVKTTEASNVASAEDAATKNAAQDAKRKVDLRKHFDKTQAVKVGNEAIEGAKSRKEALKKGIKRLETDVHGDLEGTREKVNAEANSKYNQLAEKLDPVEANPEFLPAQLDEAFQKIKGSDTEPGILKDMAKKTQQGDMLTYRDLQGYRSEIGRELSKGTLPGDVFHAFKDLQESITNEMQRIADSNGQGPQFREARDYYRRYAETFIDKDSPIRKAIDTGNSLDRKPGSVANILRGKDAAVSRVAEFDPNVSKRLNTLRGHAEEAATRTPTKAPQAEPTLSPKPARVIPKVSKIGPEGLEGANREALAKRSDAIRNRGGTWANTFVILDGIRNAIHGNLGAIGTDVAVRGAFGAGKTALANLLERPDVVKFLTKTTPEQIATIPPELRGDFPAIIQAAQKSGIEVSPALAAAFTAGTPKKRVAAALSQ